MTYRVVISDEALLRIQAQARYIAMQGGTPINAHRWLSQVLAAADRLELTPRRCPRSEVDGQLEQEIRSLNVDGFLLLFVIDDRARTVTVLSARHGRQQRKRS